MKKVFIGLGAIILIAVLAFLYFFKSDATDPYSTISWGKFSGSCASAEAPGERFGKDFKGCDYSVPDHQIPKFSSIDFPFNHVFDNKRSLPLMASALIDIDDDGVDEVFVGGGVDQQDALFKYTADGFVDITAEHDIPAKPEGTTTLGAVSFDLDSDGATDLVVSGDYGLRWYRNAGKVFEMKDLEITLDQKSTAATTTVGDYNRDGYPDIFLSAYIRLDKMEGQTIFKDKQYGASSILLQNNGDQTFTDVTEAAGLSYIHNTFQAVFVDIDNDGYLDLVVAHDTGEVRTYKNIGGIKFELRPNPITGKFAYPMGIAVGNYNNDGNIDFFFSNTGSSVPTFLARGDLAEEDIFIGKWILLRNDGSFQFTDVATEAQVADFEFSWGALFEDYNLDGRQDLVVAENYVDFPPHKLFKLPGRFLLQRENGVFAAVEDQAGVINKNYAITPLTSDFNQDGYPDLLFANLDGPFEAFINQGGKGNYISFRFSETAKYAGSHITIKKVDGTMLSDVYVIGEGLSSDQTSTVTFGLGDDQIIDEVIIRLPDGSVQTIDNPATNRVYRI